MLNLLAFMAGAESLLAFLLISRVDPLSQLGQSIVELFKSNRGSAIAKTFSAALCVLFASDLSTILNLEKRMTRNGATHADQFIVRSQLLEIALIGYCLSLELLVSSVHSYLKQVERLNWNVDVLKKQAQGAQVEYLRLQEEQHLSSSKEDDSSVLEIKSLKEVIADLREKLEHLQLDNNSKDKEIKVAKASLNALKKQSQGFCNEYDRLMDDNENLRQQLSLFDRKYSSSDVKKYS